MPVKKNLLLNSTFKILIGSAIIFQFSCSKVDTPTDPPTLTTNTIVGDLTSTSASSGGTISLPGSSSINAEGVCYSSTNQAPTLSDSHTTVATVSSTGFTSAFSGLTPGTTYYVRAYATNSYGTAYGSAVKFTTQAANYVLPATTTFAGNGVGGFVNGTGTGAELWNPLSIAADAQGNLYVGDQFNHVIRKITQSGQVSTFCGNGQLGHVDGAANVAEFYSPAGLAFDTQGNLYVVDQGNNMVIKITPAGVATTIAGNGSAGYVNSTNPLIASFNGPRGIAVDSQGNIYIADTGNERIRKISSAGVVTTFTGTGAVGDFDSDALDATFNQPYAVALDSKGVLYVADYGNYAIRKVASDGSVTTYLGNASEPTFLGTPVALTFDTTGNLFVADVTGRIMEYSSTQTVFNTLAGVTGTYSFADGSGQAALFNSPTGVAYYQGSVYVADYNNNRIRKITNLLQ